MFGEELEPQALEPQAMNEVRSPDSHSKTNLAHATQHHTYKDAPPLMSEYIWTLCVLPSRERASTATYEKGIDHLIKSPG
jgi:hypothetical protein